MKSKSDHDHDAERHEHRGMSTKGQFDDEAILDIIGIQEGDIFLDAGCADGHFSIIASKKVGPKGKVIAIDIHKESLSGLKETIMVNEIPNIIVHVADLREELPLEDSSIDHYFMSNVMHGFVYNKELGPVAGEISRVLRVGGKLTLVEWDKNNVLNGPPGHHRLSVREAEELLRPFGLKLERIEMASPEHVLMIFSKVDK
jgi:ubiquinone/menaquinone biosynthesis C-methylase UbiE